MKSAITASSGTPSPVIRMPVWPVARKLDFRPRAFNLGVDGERGVHFSDRAIGAHGKAAPARSFHAIVRWDISRLAPARRATADHRRGATAARSSSSAAGCAGPEAMVAPLFQRCTSTFFHAAEITPPLVGDPDHQRPRPASFCRGQVHVRAGDIGAAALHQELAQRQFVGAATSRIPGRPWRPGWPGRVVEVTGDRGFRSRQGHPKAGFAVARNRRARAVGLAIIRQKTGHGLRYRGALAANVREICGVAQAGAGRPAGLSACRRNPPGALRVAAVVRLNS